jgi:exosortase
MTRYALTASSKNQRPHTPAQAAVLTGVLAALVWSYWDVLRVLFREWQTDQNYSVGQLVPLAAIYLLWTDRQSLKKIPLQISWWGLLLIGFAQLIRYAGITLVFESAERYSVVFTIWGLVVLLGGFKLAWRVKWVLIFLLLMIPLPGRIHNAVSGPLQTYATSGTEIALEIIGVTVLREGNVLVLDDTTKVAVAEACSGLRMLTAFVVVAYVLAYVVERPAWQKVTLFASSIPIAIICNFVRLLTTAFLFMQTTSEIANTFFHDFAGIVMMPLAVLLLLGELWLLGRLVIPDDQPQPAS